MSDNFNHESFFDFDTFMADGINQPSFDTGDYSAPPFQPADMTGFGDEFFDPTWPPFVPGLSGQAALPEISNLDPSFDQSLHYANAATLDRATPGCPQATQAELSSTESLNAHFPRGQGHHEVSIGNSMHSSRSTEEDEAGLECKLPGDDSEASVSLEAELQQIFDSTGHGPTEATLSLICHECNTSCSNVSKLLLHSFGEGHAAFSCHCGESFTRNETLTRHIRSFQKSKSEFPCSFCKRHRGTNAFRRRDHLVQHLKGYHKFDQERIKEVVPSTSPYAEWVEGCLVQGCELYRGGRVGWRYQGQESDLPFTFSELGKHMIEAHGQKAQFLCGIPGCDWIGSSLSRELMRHMKDAHDKTPFPCKFPGCDKVGAKGYLAKISLKKHMMKKHPGVSI